MQRWARAYRDSIYHAAVETNNGTEALNRVLKYKYLPKQKHMTLSHIISSITNEFLPALHYQYVFKNFKQSNLYRSYNPGVVPSYLQGRPKGTILHCLHRKASSNKFSQSDVLQIVPNCGKFEVKGNKRKHTVDFGDQFCEPKCSCKDWTTHKIPCKHFFAVFQNVPEWGWEKLPNSYLTSPYLSLDNHAITKFACSSSEQQNSLDAVTSDSKTDPPLSTDMCDIPRKVYYSYIIYINTYTDADVRFPLFLQCKHHSTEHVAQEVRITLKSMCDFRAKFPHEDGILLRPQLCKKFKFSKQRKISQCISSLPPPPKLGRKKQNPAFRKRVGRKAQTLRKVHVCIYG